MPFVYNWKMANCTQSTRRVSGLKILREGTNSFLFRLMYSKLFLIGLVFLLSVNAEFFSSDAQQSLLDEHNRIRAEVSPPAKYALQDLTWSNELASIAEAWATQCEYGHNPLSGTDSLGENAAARTGDMSNDEEAIVQYAVVTKWEEEGDYYIITEDGFECTDPTSDACGHYAGMVGENMETVGCAYAVCDENSFAPDVSNGIWTFIVCNYNPSAPASDPVYTPCFEDPCNLDPNDETTDFFTTDLSTFIDITTPDLSATLDVSATVDVSVTVDVSTPDLISTEESTAVSTEDSSSSFSFSIGLGGDDEDAASVIVMSFLVAVVALMFL